MKSDITHGRARSQRHSERLNRAIQILVIDRVLVMPDSSGRICDLVANEGNAIDSRSRLDLVDRRSGPGLDGRLHSHRGSDGRKGETGGASHTELTVGDIVVHVALPRMSLAPGVFMGSDVLTFGPVGRARIQRCVQIALLHLEPVRRPGMGMARVVVCGRWEGAGKGIYPCARTQPTLGPVVARRVRIGTSHAQVSAVGSRTTTKAANILLQGSEGMFQPGLADLFEAVVITGSAAHAIQILRNDGVVGIRQREPIEFLGSVVTGSRCHREADNRSRTSRLRHGRQISDDDINPRNGVRRVWSAGIGPVPRWRQDRRLNFTVGERLDLDGSKTRHDGDFSDDGVRFPRTSKFPRKFF